MNKTSENSLSIGQVLNEKWVILEFIARGGMGDVYRAHQLTLNRDVAIKIISHELIQDFEDDEEEFENALQRFRNEVYTMSHIRHPNVLQIYDYDSFTVQKNNKDITVEYIVMEYIPGRTLRSTMSEEGFYPEEDMIREWLRNYFLPVLNGVSALHHAHIIHRDLKPENILLDGNIPKIADFGLARSSRLSAVTQTIEVKGTPAYMSPEHLFNFRKADEQADIYSLGKILYEAVAGRIPMDTMPFKTVGLDNPTTPFFKELNGIIRDATAEKKDERLKSVEEFKSRLLGAIETAGASQEEVKWSPDDGDTLPEARSKKFWFAMAVSGLFFFLAVFWIWHYLEKPGNLFPHAKKLQVTSHKESPVKGSIALSKISPSIVKATDGAILHRIPGGTFTLPKVLGLQSKQQVTIQSFYMDETPVTNYQYVTFLNQVLSRVNIEGTAVKSHGKVWLYLGEILEGYEPIVFVNGEFQINNPVHSSCPVVRVSAYGAAAYARFYGRRLPTEGEWLYTALKGGTFGNTSSGNAAVGSKQNTSSGLPVQTGEPPNFPSPVILYKPNAFGIRGINGPIGEWVLDILAQSGKLKTENLAYSVMGGFGEAPEGKTSIPAIVKRQPWEAFEEIGFRCAQDINARKN